MRIQSSCKSCPPNRLHFADTVAAAGTGKDDLDLLLRTNLDYFGLQFRWTPQLAKAIVIHDNSRNSGLIERARKKGQIVITPKSLLNRERNICFKGIKRLKQPEFSTQLSNGHKVFLYIYADTKKVAKAIRRTGAEVAIFGDRRAGGFRRYHWSGMIWGPATAPLNITSIVFNDWYYDSYFSFTAYMSQIRCSIPVYPISEVLRTLRRKRLL